MTCAEVHAAVRDGNVDTPGNRTHAETCVACAQILAHPEPWHTASSAAGASTLPPETLDLLAEAIVVNAAGSMSVSASSTSPSQSLSIPSQISSAEA